MATVKKAVAKKAVAKKAATKTTAGPSGPQTGQPAEGFTPNISISGTSKETVERTAKRVLAGQFGTGRDRTDALRTAGHDPDIVATEVARQQAVKARGSSWT